LIKARGGTVRGRQRRSGGFGDAAADRWDYVVLCPIPRARFLDMILAGLRGGERTSRAGSGETRHPCQHGNLLQVIPK